MPPQLKKNPSGNSNGASEVSFEQLANGIRGRDDWHAILSAHRGRPKSRNLNGLIGGVRLDLQRGKTAMALAWCRAGAYVDARLFVREARRHGLFRSSKVRYRVEAVAYLVQALIKDGPALKWTDDEIAYLESVASLLTIAAGARSLQASIVQRLTKHRSAAIKSAMVCVDRAFRPNADHQQSEEEAFAESIGHPLHFSREAKAAGLSTLVSLMQEFLGWAPDVGLSVDEKGIRDGFYEQLLWDASQFAQYMDAEVLLDAFPYRARITSNPPTVEIAALDDRFEKSICLGFIHSIAQGQIFITTNQKAASAFQALRDEAKKIYGLPPVSRTHPMT